MAIKGKRLVKLRILEFCTHNCFITPEYIVVCLSSYIMSQKLQQFDRQKRHEVHCRKRTVLKIIIV